MSEPTLYVQSWNLVVLKGFLEEKEELVERVLRALVRAERFVRDQPGPAIRLISRHLQIDESALAAWWPEIALRVRLGEELLLVMEDEARWAMDAQLAPKVAMPNYLYLVHCEILRRVKPAAVTVVY